MIALVCALREFAQRVARLDPPQSSTATLVTVGDEEIALSATAAEALIAMLDGYTDPRSNGDCEGCGGQRVDGNFICLDCGHANGVFGQMLRERSARYPGDPEALAAS